MKFNYTNILLFALPLNILLTLCHVYNQRKHKRTTPNHMQTNRSLCECKLYSPANYDSDPQMKKVMEKFNKQTQQRLRDYDDRMIEKRMQCKDKCDKEIQKIILKDKLERQMAQQLTTLETKIDTNDIPTCICEKYLADKMEKECLKCAQNLGGIVAPSSGVLIGIAEGALYAWKSTALDAAIKAAIAKGATKISIAGFKASEAVGLAKVIAELEALSVHKLIPEMSNSIGTTIHYTNAEGIASFINTQRSAVCMNFANDNSIETMCEIFDKSFGILKADGSAGLVPKVAVPQKITEIVGQANQGAAEAAEAARQSVTAEITTEQTNAINTIFMGKQTAIIASVVAIVVIILIMVIIYLILRYRRKKKMKKKIQYIKLLKE